MSSCPYYSLHLSYLLFGTSTQLRTVMGGQQPLFLVALTSIRRKKMPFFLPIRMLASSLDGMASCSNGIQTITVQEIRHARLMLAVDLLVVATLASAALGRRSAAATAHPSAMLSLNVASIPTLQVNTTVAIFQWHSIDMSPNRENMSTERMLQPVRFLWQHGTFLR